MAFKVAVSKGGGGGEMREACPPDEYPAVLVAVIDLGHQHKKKFESQEMEWRPMVALVWEIQEAKSERGEPFYFAEEYRQSLHEKATLAKVLLAGGVVIPEDAAQFDLEAVLGRPYLLTIEEATSAGGKKYSRIARGGVAKLPKALAKGLQKPARQPFSWTIDQGAMPAHDWLPFLYGQAIHEIQAESRELSGKGAPPADGGEPTDHNGGPIPF